MNEHSKKITSNLMVMLLMLLALLVAIASFMPLFSIELTDKTPTAKQYANNHGADVLSISAVDIISMIANYK